VFLLMDGDKLVYDYGKISVNQLIVGYVDEQTNAACGSITLVNIDGYKILFDCGLPSTEFLSNFDPTSISCIIISHWHSDHCAQLHKFSHAHQILPDDNQNPVHLPNEIGDTNQILELLKLSGHSLVDLVLVVRPDITTDECIVIAGLSHYQ
jgi:ribonuclease BN (tRNA processing enzyme)